MLATLKSQLHFVQAVRAVNTDGVEPLAAIRDETTAGRAEMTIGLTQLQAALDAEDKVGKHQRPRRRAVVKDNQEESWDPLGTAGWTEGRYVVVKTGARPHQC